MTKKDKNKTDLKGRTPDELQNDLLNLKKQQFNMRFQLSQSQLANTAQIRQTRRQIARVLHAQHALAATGANSTAEAEKKPGKAKKSAVKTA